MRRASRDPPGKHTAALATYDDQAGARIPRHPGQHCLCTSGSDLQLLHKFLPKTSPQCSLGGHSTGVPDETVDVRYTISGPPPVGGTGTTRVTLTRRIVLWALRAISQAKDAALAASGERSTPAMTVFQATALCPSVTGVSLSRGMAAAFTENRRSSIAFATTRLLGSVLGSPPRPDHPFAFARWAPQDHLRDRSLPPWHQERDTNAVMASSSRGAFSSSKVT